MGPYTVVALGFGTCMAGLAVWTFKKAGEDNIPLALLALVLLLAQGASFFVAGDRYAHKRPLTLQSRATTQRGDNCAPTSYTDPHALVLLTAKPPSKK